MATVFSGRAGEVCQDSGIYRSEYGEHHRILIEKGQHFPGGGIWHRVNDYPDAQAMASEQARQRFWQALG